MNPQLLFKFDNDNESNLSMLEQLQSKHIEQSCIQLLQEQNKNSSQNIQNNDQIRNSFLENQEFSNKIFYKNKFNDIILSEETQKLKDCNYKKNRKIKKASNTKDKQEKLKRNRENVKNCRERRKEYISLLQNKISEKDKKINELTTLLQETQLERDRLKNSDQIYINSFLQAQQQCKQKIIMAYSQSKQILLKDFLNEYRQRFGPAGKDRVNLLNYHMSEIVENLLGDKQKYLINCFVKSRYIFGSNDRDIELEMKSASNFDKLHQKFSRIYKPILQKDLQAFNLQIQTFYNSYVKLRDICNNFQRLFSIIKNQYSNEEIAKNYIWFQENKHRKQLNLKGQWYQVFKGSQRSIIEKLKKQKTH